MLVSYDDKKQHVDDSYIRALPLLYNEHPLSFLREELATLKSMSMRLKIIDGVW